MQNFREWNNPEWDLIKPNQSKRTLSQTTLYDNMTIKPLKSEWHLIESNYSEWHAIINLKTLSEL